MSLEVCDGRNVQMCPLAKCFCDIFLFGLPVLRASREEKVKVDDTRQGLSSRLQGFNGGALLAVVNAERSLASEANKGAIVCP